MYKFLLALLTFSLESLQSYDLGNNVSINYVERYPPFPGSLDNRYIIGEETGRRSCEMECNRIEECAGYTHFSSTDNCNLLNETQLGNGYNLENASSFKKEIYYHYLRNHTFSGIVYFTENSHQNSLVYVDMNHNNMFDVGEPHNYTDKNGIFEINGLSDGLYAVKMVSPEDCYELYPGRYGVSQSYRGEGYFDYVKYYYPYNELRGGTLGGQGTEVSLDFILSDNNNTYLSFADGNVIVLGMRDDVIVNGTGSDIFFNTFGDPTVSANVSFSHDGESFFFGGVLNNSHNDLDINLSVPVRFVRLDFFDTTSSKNTLMNIRNVRSRGRVYYNPGFLYYVQAPDDDLLFIADCSYHYSCNIFCGYYVNPYQARSSCSYGCQYFSDTKRCDCHYDEDYNFVYGEFNKTECRIGCMYQLSRTVYPNYTVYDNAMGVKDDSLEIFNDFDSSLEVCSEERYCFGITMSDYRSETSSQGSFRFVQDEDYYFIAKNSIRRGMELDYMTTSPTSTLTTSPTSTLTTSPTSTLTTSPTTSPTSTLTTSPTSTLTSTLTSTPTTTVTIESGMTPTEITIIVVICAGVPVLIIMFILYKYCQITKKPFRVRPVLYRDSYTNPTYDNTYFDPSKAKDDYDHTYNEVFIDEIDEVSDI